MHPRKKRRQFTRSEKQAWIIAQRHEERANNPVKQARINAQAVQLVRERIAEFGEAWEAGCAIRVPEDVLEAIREVGPLRWLEIEAKQPKEN